MSLEQARLVNTTFMALKAAVVTAATSAVNKNLKKKY
jgi:hypothetical protein